MLVRCIICGKLNEADSHGADVSCARASFVCRPCASLVAQQALKENHLG